MAMRAKSLSRLVPASNECTVLSKEAQTHADTLPEKEASAARRLP
jgi:hypothetical protein